MTNANERNFCEGQKIYVIDWGYPAKDFVAVKRETEIRLVNNEEKWFVAILDDELYEKYLFEDYGILVFDNEKDADEAVKKIPIPGTVVYQIIGGIICKRKVYRISENMPSSSKEIIIRFNRGKTVSIKQLNKTVFLTREKAKEGRKNLKASKR